MFQLTVIDGKRSSLLWVCKSNRGLCKSGSIKLGTTIIMSSSLRQGLSVALACLDSTHRDPPAPVSQLLGLKACATLSGTVAVGCAVSFKAFVTSCLWGALENILLQVSYISATALCPEWSFPEGLHSNHPQKTMAVSPPETNYGLLLCLVTNI